MAKQANVDRVGFRTAYQMKRYQLSKNLRGIPSKSRLNYLIKMASKGRSISWAAWQQRRAAFNAIKHKQLPLGNHVCYVCEDPAVIRHHVIPLIAGGRNKRNNIVPLCLECHSKVHPGLVPPVYLQEMAKAKAHKHFLSWFAGDLAKDN
jgi:5-methylcytosine-specific restriction endonuclease McrA